MAKRLLGDVLVDRRYAQIARSATEFAVRRLAPGGKPPQIRFFHSNGTTKGFFDRREPGWINIAEGLSDIELVRTCMHEASHSVTPAGGTETIAQYDETWLAREYCAAHGRNTSHGWEACA